MSRRYLFNSHGDGVINIVPKRAHEDLASVTANYASDTQLTRAGEYLTVDYVHPGKVIVAA